MARPKPIVWGLAALLCFAACSTATISDGAGGGGAGSGGAGSGGAGSGGVGSGGTAGSGGASGSGGTAGTGGGLTGTCAEEDCSGNGICQMSGNGPVCICNDHFVGLQCGSCDEGYAGPDCAACDTGFHPNPTVSGDCLPDPCFPDPCNGHGSCSTATGAPVCTCDPEWDGAACDTCAINWSGAACDTCAQGWTGEFCAMCATGYVGASCDTCDSGFFEFPAGSGACIDDPCLPDPCNGHGACANHSGAEVCTCDPAWIGAACDSCATGYTGAGCNGCDTGYYEYPAASGICVDDPCLPDPCSGRGTCTNDTGYFACACVTGWGGSTCDTCAPGYLGAACDACDSDYYEHPPASGICIDDPCLPDPCNGHGTCARDTGVFVCACDAERTGDRCQDCIPGTYEYPADSGLCIDDPCDPLPCNDNGYCTNSSGAAVCHCDTGFSGSQCEVCDTTFFTDDDTDGWTKCDGDCCESEADGCADPIKVNPGAYDFPGNDLDDDCDGIVDNTPGNLCSGSPDFADTTGVELVQAMDLCQFTVETPPTPQDSRWGVIDALVYGPDGGGAPNQLQTAVLLDLGPNIVPRKNATMAAIASGTARDPLDPGYVNPQTASYVDGTNTGTAPIDYTTHQPGGELSSSPDCPTGGTGINDVVEIYVRIRVPTNAVGFEYNFNFLTAEYPEWSCTVYNDFYLALLYSGDPAIPADLNISFDADNNPVSVNNGFFTVCQMLPCGGSFNGDDINPADGCPDNMFCDAPSCSTILGACPDTDAELVDSGYPPDQAGGTGWLTTSAPVRPGEIITLRFYIWDTSDHALDSLVLLDNFTWRVEPTSVVTW